MDQQTIPQMISAILQQILGSGLAINGDVGIKGLTITSIDKARSLGIIASQSQGQNESQQQSDQSSQQQGQSQDDQQPQQRQSGSQVSREEFNNMIEELRYVRKLMEASQQEQPSSRGRGQANKQ